MNATNAAHDTHPYLDASDNPIRFDRIMREAIAAHASDLHFTVDSPPLIRIDDRISSLPHPKLDVGHIRQFATQILSTIQLQELDTHRSVDFSCSFGSDARFRGNIYYQRGSLSISLRLLPYLIPTFEELGIPIQIQRMAERPDGLFLVTGPTGSGKSTTLAVLLEKINREKSCHIVTIEDPVEYLFVDKKSFVSQREIGTDAESFSEALKHVLRQDPDVVLVGELRDLESIESALILAETGHLVFGTLHTQTASQAISRIVDIYPSTQQRQVMMQLSLVLNGIFAQRLLPKIGGSRVLASEILIVGTGVRGVIRENRIQNIENAIATGLKYGMHSLNQSLFHNFVKGNISLEEAVAASENPVELADLISASSLQLLQELDRQEKELVVDESDELIKNHIRLH